MRSAAVFIGGAVGTLARWAVSLAVPAAASFPLATLIVNVSGAFGLGFAGVLLTERLRPRPALRSFAAIGFFGAYTTFSTMAVEGVRLIESGRVAATALYWVLTLLLGQMAGVYGMWAGRIQVPEREEPRNSRARASSFASSSASPTGGSTSPFTRRSCGRRGRRVLPVRR